MNKIVKNEISREVRHDGKSILKYRIEYPQMVESPFGVGEQPFNAFYKNKAIELQKYADGEFYNMAVDTYEISIKNGYPIMQYELVLSYTITYNELCVVSLYLDEYTFTGGAHGNTIRTAQTWNLKDAHKVSIAELFPINLNYEQKLLTEIDSQITGEMKSGKSYYFDDYKKLASDTFSSDQFSLTPQGIVIYYQQYDIAPYSSGIPTFLIDGTDIPILLPYCY